jgi:L-rhamnose mutarotase
MIEEVKSASDNRWWLNVLTRSREASLVLLIVALTALTTALNPRFLSPQSLKDQTPVCRRWWDYMAGLMQVNADNSPCSVDLREMFHLSEENPHRFRNA